ncbi:AVN_HP_G0129630.mRNA.1.CDS.1 [Saccharomyces cerevisiae]|nr:AVN_HP_G0129630.mRNA.1.CDS.1 [Saccharomyces cerevisiae]CAI6397037.1 AVN_HP_G0129630.mRNA.1.CDS.1 [Saccharomyces cerevisiae]
MDALSAQRLAKDPTRLSHIQYTLRRSFTVPIKGYVQRHSLPLTLGMKKKITPEPRLLHDPTDEFAIVLYDPSVDGEMISLYIDPKLAKILRPLNEDPLKSDEKALTESQKTEQNNRGAYGCIMADEMGLGKTLQCIALMWTLLRQGPQGKRLIDKCIIVCPSSLVNNWANELINGFSQAIHAWAQAQGRNIVKPVLIISYETLRRNVDQLKNCNVGLMLADEGHRLKNGDSLTFTALDSISCPRRVILSGTPIQNDLSEYFALLSFSNPGLLGSRAEFRKKF